MASAELGPGAPPADAAELPARDFGRLLLRCPDQPGLIAPVSGFLTGAGANIVTLDQHATSWSGGTFMQRAVLLWRTRRGELDMSLAMVIGNHAGRPSA